MTELHIVSANDELSSRNGSAILQIAVQLQRAAADIGEQAWIGGGELHSADLHNCVQVLRHKSLRWRRIAQKADSLIKYLLGISLTAPVVLETKLAGVTHIFCHNQPWILGSVRRVYPEARVHLYVHNRILLGARPRIIRRILRSFDTVICVSEFIAQDLEARAKHVVIRDAASNVRAIFNGVDQARFSQVEDLPDESAVDVVYVGRIVPDKGTLVLARAVARLAKTQKIRLRIVGGAGFIPTDELSAYERQVLEVLERGRVDYEFTGPVPPERVPGLINSARLLVVPSVWDEPCGLVLLEGLASEAGVVATRVGGMPEVGEDSGAAFIDPNNEEALAGAMSALLADDPRRKQLADAGQSWAGTRGWARVYIDIREAVS